MEAESQSMTGLAKGATPDDGAACPGGPPRAMLVPVRQLPKEATPDQEFTVPSSLSNCIMVNEAQCCIGRRPSGTPLTCIVPESWVAMSSCHCVISWEGGKVIFKDTSSNGTFSGKDHSSQQGFTRLPKGRPQTLSMGDYVMFSQWSNNRTNDELLIYHIEAVPESSSDIQYKKREGGHGKSTPGKGKTPKSAKSHPPQQSAAIAGSMAPCKHCAKQAADALASRSEMQAEQHKATALSKELDGNKKKVQALDQEVKQLQEQLRGIEKLQGQLFKAQNESETACKSRDAAVLAAKEKDEQHKVTLAKAEEARKKIEAEKKQLAKELAECKAQHEEAVEKLKHSIKEVCEKESSLKAEVTMLKEQNKALAADQEKRGAAEATKLKEEHEVEIAELQKVQLRLEKEAAAWRLKTETVSRTLPDALEKSMIPQLHKAARQCIHKLLQDVNALNDTTPSDLFGGTPTHFGKQLGNERSEVAGLLGQSQHTMCFSSPANFAGMGPDIPQTEMFEGDAVDQGGCSAVPSQEGCGPSVSLRHGFALSQANTALEKSDTVEGQGLKDCGSPLLKGFVRKGTEDSGATGAPGQDVDGNGEAGEGNKHVSAKLQGNGAALQGEKRKLNEMSRGNAEASEGSDDFGKPVGQEMEEGEMEDSEEDPEQHGEENAMGRGSTTALAKRLKALKNQEEAVAC